MSVAVDPVDNTNIERHDVVGGTSAPHQGTTADIGASPSGATAIAGVPASCVAGGDTAAADVASAQRKVRLAAEAAIRQQIKIDNCRFYHEALTRPWARRGRSSTGPTRVWHRPWLRSSRSTATAGALWPAWAGNRALATSGKLCCGPVQRAVPIRPLFTRPTCALNRTIKNHLILKQLKLHFFVHISALDTFFFVFFAMK